MKDIGVAEHGGDHQITSYQGSLLLLDKEIDNDSRGSDEHVVEENKIKKDEFKNSKEQIRYV